MMKFFDKQIAYFKKNRYGVMSAYLVGGSCIGSIATMLILQARAGALLLAIAAFATMTSNAVCIAQGSPRLCVLTFYVSLGINGLLILTLLSYV